MPSGKAEVDAWKRAAQAQVPKDPGNQADDNIDYALGCSDLLCCVLDGVTGGSAGAVIGGALDLLGASAKTGVPIVANPYFIMNGHDDDADCPLTRNYMKSRIWKGAGAPAITLTGTAASAGTWASTCWTSACRATRSAPRRPISSSSRASPMRTGRRRPSRSGWRLSC